MTAFRQISYNNISCVFSIGPTVKSIQNYGRASRLCCGVDDHGRWNGKGRMNARSSQSTLVGIGPFGLHEAPYLLT